MPNFVSRAGNRWVAALLMLLLVASAEAQARPEPSTQDPQRQEARPQGHMVLVVEGNARALRVVFARAREGRFGGPKKGLKSTFRFVALGADDRVLHDLPIDVSEFETDPAKVDAPTEVRGCKVKSPNISVLLNAPRDPAAVRYELRRGKAVIGRISAVDLARLLGGAR